MWSPFYAYYSIQSDNFSEELDAQKVIDVLSSIDVLERQDLQSFQNKPDFPYISISIYYTKDGNFAHRNEALKTVTLIDIVATKRVEQSIFIALMSKIAIELGWKIFLDEDDEDNEHVEIKPIS